MNRDIEKHIGGATSYELPKELYGDYRRAVRLEWLTIAYLVSVFVILYLTMGSSAAMKAVLVETVVSTSPAIAFLCASRTYNKTSSSQYPYGYHKVFTVAFVVGSVALLVLGLYILVDSSLSFAKREHPTIASISLFGYNIWMGWLMIAALLYGSVPAIMLGRLKVPLARSLHEKVLYVDSEAQKADWKTGTAGILGIIGIGFGFWWADSLAAILISLNIVYDGVIRTRDSTRDLMEELPMTFDNQEVHSLVGAVVRLCLAEEWVKDVRVRMREHGMVFFGDVAVIPETEDDLTNRIERLRQSIYHLDWKIKDMVITPVHGFPEPDISMSGTRHE